MSVLKRSSVTYGGGVDISNTLGIAAKKEPSPAAEHSDKPEVHSAPAEPVISPAEQLEIRERQLAEREAAVAKLEQELAALKERYIEQGKEVILEAKRRAEGITQSAQQEAAGIIADAEQNRDSVFIKARAEGFEQGRKEGVDAYLAEGRDTLEETRQINAAINAEKEALFERYEKEIFDTVMAIANKVTLDSMSVKDGTAAKKLIKKAAKEFRNAQVIRISLDRNGASEEIAADYELLNELCSGAQHVEVELLPDAEPGTVIVDNGSEITDAGIQTQLRMIQELGSGKFLRPPARKKKKSPADSAEE